MPEIPTIEIHDVHHSFRDHKALNGISFQVQAGQLHGFVGPNGAGKTTTLKLICTLMRPQTGFVKVFGHDVLSQVKKVRRRLGYMPDHFSMYRQMTVFEYLDFFAAAYGIGSQQRDQVISDVLELTDMKSRHNSLIQGLSRGMQQRVSLARVLVNDPDLLLLDEPASGLDPRARIELMDILRALRGMGKTIFISSHILSELAELCDSVTIIDHGRIKYTGPIDELLHDEEPQITYLVRVAEMPPDVGEIIQQIDGVIQVTQLDNKPEIQITIHRNETHADTLLRGMLERGMSIVSCTPSKKHLNQAFMDLTQGGIA